MSDIDELHQLMSGAHDRRDDALLDILNALAGSPATHTPQPTPALAMFLQHPTPPQAAIPAPHPPSWSGRLWRPRARTRPQFLTAVLAGWLTPLLLGTATAVAATTATAALLAYTSHPAAPANPSPASPPVTSTPTASQGATPARPRPTGPGRASTTSTPYTTVAPTHAAKPGAGSSGTQSVPTRTAAGSHPRADHSTAHTTAPTSPQDDRDPDTDSGDNQNSRDNQDIEAPQATGTQNSETQNADHEDRDDEDRGYDSAAANPDHQGSDQGDS